MEVGSAMVHDLSNHVSLRIIDEMHFKVEATV